MPPARLSARVRCPTPGLRSRSCSPSFPTPPWRWKPARTVPWISRYLTGLGAKVLVANPRKLHAISRSERKCDRRDALMLARLARVDPALLHPIQHGSAQAQHDLLGLKLRDALVRTRVNLINAVRFTLKSLGHPVRNPSSESFHKTVTDVPADCLPVVQPLLTVLAQVTEQIKAMERDLVHAQQKRLSRHPAAPADRRRGPAHRALLRPQDR